jgi:hypothetical protein
VKFIRSKKARMRMFRCIIRANTASSHPTKSFFNHRVAEIALITRRQGPPGSVGIFGPVEMIRRRALLHGNMTFERARATINKQND